MYFEAEKLEKSMDYSKLIVKVYWIDIVSKSKPCSSTFSIDSVTKKETCSILGSTSLFST